MDTDLQYLGLAIILGLVHVFLAATLATRVRGLQWNASNRDENPQPLNGVAARAGRASSNFLETFPFFAAAVLAAELAHVSNPHTALGAKIYFFARLAYLPVYLVGIPYLRTAIWAVSFWGLLQILEALF